jgi:hypothetical protein
MTPSSLPRSGASKEPRRFSSPVHGAGRVLLHKAAAETLFSSLEWAVLPRHGLTNTRQAQAVVLEWCYRFYNYTRQHSSAGTMSPVNCENTSAPRPGSRIGNPSTFRGGTTHSH